MTAQCDSIDGIIIGGGIAGLWCLRRLQAAGYRMLLLSRGPLGSGQTIHSQGIIHGGAKYSLNGVVSDATKAIQDMPQIWRDCFAGDGIIDLRQTEILSQHHQMWHQKSFAMGLVGMMASQVMQADHQQLQPPDYPPLFQNPKFRGQIFQLAEQVIEPRSLLTCLQQPSAASTYELAPSDHVTFSFDENQNLTGLTIRDAAATKLQLACRFGIFAAAAGQQEWAQAAGVATATQVRPLQMVYAQGPQLQPIYGHLIKLGTVPRLTLTSHPVVRAGQKQWVWYLGGGLAEDGVDRSPHEQCEAARSLLQGFFSWLDFTTIKVASFPVDRHEPKTPGGKKPKESVVQQFRSNLFFAWPTKLTFAPLLGQQVFAAVAAARIPPSHDQRPLEVGGSLKQATVAQPHWWQDN